MQQSEYFLQCEWCGARNRNEREECRQSGSPIVSKDAVHAPANIYYENRPDGSRWPMKYNHWGTTSPLSVSITSTEGRTDYVTFLTTG